MGSRTKQPPKNEVNALISFGNMMCYTETLRAVHQTQLNPTISFLHTPGERRYSLCLDISEIFKPIIVDRVIFKVLNKHALSNSHFDKKLNKCLLNEKGKKIFVKAMEERYDETFRHRSLGRNVSYKHLIKLLSEAKLRELKLKIKGIIDQSEDSIIIFTNKIGYNMDKQILGKERMSTDNFL